MYNHYVLTGYQPPGPPSYAPNHVARPPSYGSSQSSRPPSYASPGQPRPPSYGSSSQASRSSSQAGRSYGSSSQRPISQHQASRPPSQGSQPSRQSSSQTNVRRIPDPRTYLRNRRIRPRNYISPLLKCLLFSFNFLFWVGYFTSSIRNLTFLLLILLIYSSATWNGHSWSRTVDHRSEGQGNPGHSGSVL